MRSIRPAAVAGMFYPRDPRALADEVRRHLQTAEAATAATPRPKLLVVPHAGYIYSGAIAAQAYAQMLPWAGEIRRIVLLGPAHRVALRGIAAPTVDVFETPLGTMAIDRAALAAIAELPQVQPNDLAHAQEHSLEVQLPFLQAVFGNRCSLVPLVVGHVGAAAVAEVIERLWGGDETLVVISTDLSHYHPDGQARAIDHRTAQRIVAQAADIDPHEACGAFALNGAMQAVRQHGLQGTLLDLRNSSDTAGEPDRVVGYGALAFAPAAQADPSRDEERLGQALLARAHNTIARALGLRGGAEPGHPALQHSGATFVSLHDASGRLRGCIGRLRAVTVLDADVRHNAAQAAFKDPRFPPLTAAEWPGLQIEVSLLGTPEPLPDAHSFDEAGALLQPGLDGVILECRGQQATFLPQVWQQLPEPRAFLSALLRKAGLPEQAWPAGVRLQRYRVRSFERKAAVQ